MSGADQSEILSRSGKTRTLDPQVQFDRFVDLIFNSVQPAIVDIENRVVAQDTRNEQVAGITGRCWHHYSQSGNVSKPGV
jgi:hypothetical protein